MPSENLFLTSTRQDISRRTEAKETATRSVHLSISVHTTLLEDLNLSRLPRPLSLKIDLELGRSHTKHLQDGSLPGVQRLALSANGEALLALGQLEHDLTLHQTSGDAQFAHGGLNGVADGLILVGGDLATAGSDQTIGESERAGGHGTGTGKVRGAEVFEVLDDGLGGARGEEKADGTGQVRRKTVQVLSGFVFGRGAEGDGHNFGLAEEETGDIRLVD